jgi:hypothetical protein
LPLKRQKNILFFKINFHNEKQNYEISAINIGNFFGKFIWFLSLCHNKETTFFNFFLQKWGEIMFYQIKGKINVGNYWIPALQWVDWPSKKLFDFRQILYFAFPL